MLMPKHPMGQKVSPEEFTVELQEAMNQACICGGEVLIGVSLLNQQVRVSLTASRTSYLTASVLEFQNAVQSAFTTDQYSA
jgi:hypothetical protein